MAPIKQPGITMALVVWAVLSILFTAFMVLVVRALLKYLRTSDRRAENSAIKRSLGEVLKSHRTECGMTQEFVAEHLDVSRQTVSKWETGVNEPGTSNLLRLAKLFGVPADALLKEIEP